MSTTFMVLLRHQWSTLAALILHKTSLCTATVSSVINYSLTALTTSRAGTQVAMYNYMKLKMMQAKAALSTGKDAEKGGGSSVGAVSPQLTADARSPTAPAPAPAQAASADYTSFRRAPCPVRMLGWGDLRVCLDGGVAETVPLPDPPPAAASRRADGPFRDFGKPMLGVG